MTPARLPALAAGLLLALAAGPLAAQSAASDTAASAGAPAQPRVANGARFGAWTVACEAIAVGETACVLSQRLVRSSDNAFLTDLLLFWDGATEQAYLAARVPNGVFFPDGFSLIAEDAEEGTTLEWQSCSPEICEAALPLAMDDLGTLETAEGLRALYRPGIATDPLAFRISVEGAVEGLEALAAAQRR